jgi:Flp pilus assembly protein TadG
MRLRVPRGIVRLHRDERGLVIGFFIKILLSMMLVGLAIEEGGQMIVAQIKAEGAAREAAQAAADSYRGYHDPAKAKSAARAAAHVKDSAARLTNLTISADGSATVTIHEEAHTLVVKHISFLKGWGEQEATLTESHS